MTRNRFNHNQNQSKHQSTSRSTSTNNLTISKARRLFLENNNNIDMKDTYKIASVHPLTDEKMLLIKSIVTITYYPLLIK